MKKFIKSIAPNTWGKQSFDKDFKTWERDPQRDFENNRKAYPKTFIQRWVEDNMSGVKNYKSRK